MRLHWSVGCSTVYIPVATHIFNRLQLSSYTNCNLGGRPVAFRLDRPVATAMDGWLQLRLYTSSNSARQPIASSVVHKLQLIPLTDCNFHRTQIATLVLGQLHSGWVGQLQLPWMAGCSSVCIPVPTQPVSRLHLQSYINCNSSFQPIATSVVHKLQLVRTLAVCLPCCLVGRCWRGRGQRCVARA